MEITVFILSTIFIPNTVVRVVLRLALAVGVVAIRFGEEFKDVGPYPGIYLLFYMKTLL